MKRHILFICLICGFYSGVNAQTYYNMWRGFGEAGKPEERNDAVLLEVVEGEDVEKMDALLSLAITGGNYDWI